jgi:hypothetical protein
LEIKDEESAAKRRKIRKDKLAADGRGLPQYHLPELPHYQMSEIRGQRSEVGGREKAEVRSRRSPR